MKNRTLLMLSTMMMLALATACSQHPADKNGQATMGKPMANMQSEKTVDKPATDMKADKMMEKPMPDASSDKMMQSM